MNLTPSERAKKIYANFYSVPLYVKVVKMCANLEITDIVNELKLIDENHPRLEYWEEVRSELEKIQ